MIYNVYAMRDVKTGFLTPTCELSDASAIRNFENAVVRDVASVLWTHSEDFMLYKIGEYDTDTGNIQGVLPVQVSDAASVVRLRGL